MLSFVFTHALATCQRQFMVVIVFGVLLTGWVCLMVIVKPSFIFISPITGYCAAELRLKLVVSSFFSCL